MQGILDFVFVSKKYLDRRENVVGLLKALIADIYDIMIHVWEGGCVRGTGWTNRLDVEEILKVGGRRKWASGEEC